MTLFKSSNRLFTYQKGITSTPKVEGTEPLNTSTKDELSASEYVHCDKSMLPESNIKVNMTYVEPIGNTQKEVYEYLIGNPTGITLVHGKAGCGKATHETIPIRQSNTNIKTRVI